MSTKSRITGHIHLGYAISLAELMTDGTKRFLSGVYRPENLKQDGTTQEREDVDRARPVCSASGRIVADMMMMMMMRFC